MNRRRFLTTVSASSFAFAAGCSGGGGSTATPTPDPEQIKEEAYAVEYSDLLRNVEDYDGEPLHFARSTVLQVQEDDEGTFAIRIGVNEDWDDVFGYWQGDRFIEDDIVEAWAVGTGPYTYETVMGNERTIPGVNFVDIELLEEG